MVRKPRARVAFATAWILILTNAFPAEERKLAMTDYKRLSLEELMNIEVTSVSRKAERFSESAAAIEVLTTEQIHRSGANNIPDLLRLGTGMHVAQVDGHTWAISTRGFNLPTANKLQVLMDGRSLYSPLFSGTFWDVQDYLLEDLDRIEIIRGPGGAMWGANAFNGVINILSRSARDTQGGLLLGGGGTEENGFGGVRYGGQLATNSYYRVYAKYFNRDGLRYPSGARSHDELMIGQTGFRTDTDLPADNLLTIQGDYYDGFFGRDRLRDSHIAGGNILGRWTKKFSESSELQIQTYWDRTYRHQPESFRENRSTFDLDTQHRFRPHDRHEVMWGFNYRLSSDSIHNPSPGLLAFVPAERNLQLFDLFLQDEITLIDHTLGLNIGSKFGHNDYSGFEFQPNVRLAYHPTTNQTLWSAVSRAVRTPTRIDVDLSAPSILLLPRTDGGFRAEEVIAYELGYRVQPYQRLALDTVLFYNNFDNLRSVEPLPSGFFMESNETEGDAYGVELAATVEPLERWRLRPSYAYLEMRLEPSSAGRDPLGASREGNDPHHILSLHSMIDLPGRVQFDQILRYVSDLPQPSVPAYLTLDLRLAWLPSDSLEIAIIGRNLLDKQHPEYGAPTPFRKEIERSVFGKVTWRF